MSQITIETLQIENFLSIKEGTLNLENRGLLLIQGINEDDSSANSNGAGKSSVVDALSWALYGITARGRSGDKVVNRTAKKNCRVEVKFREGEDVYTVTRYRKHTKGKSRLHLFKGESDLTLGTDKLTQEQLEKILGCSQEVFMASIYAGQGCMPNLPAMTDKELKELVEEAAGGKALEAAYEIARKRSQEAEKAALVVATRYETQERTQGALELQIEEARENVTGWASENAGQIATAEKSVNDALTKAKGLKEKATPEARAGLEARIESIKADIASVASPPPAPIAPVAPSYPAAAYPKPRPLPPAGSAALAVNVGKNKVKLEHATKQLGNLAHELKHLNDKVGTACGECSKTYEEGDLAARKTTIAKQAGELKTERDSLMSLIAADEASIRELEELHTRQIAEVDLENSLAADSHAAICASLDAEYEEARETHQKALDAHRAAIAKLDTSKLLAALTVAQSELTAFDSVVADIKTTLTLAKTIRERVEELKAATNPWEKEVEKRSEELDRVLDVRKATREELDLKNEAVEVAKAAVAVFAPNGIRGELLDSVTPFLNDRTATYLGALSDGNIEATWLTVGETEKGELREKFHIDVDNKHGDEDFEGLSGGEQRKVRIATAMALQDLVASRAHKPLKLFVADEVDDALDVSGLERLMGILEDKARTTGTVLTISHNDIGDWVRDHITVRKSGGQSIIEEAA